MKKNEFIRELLQDIAVLHNMSLKKAAHYKQIHQLLLGAENALASHAYDDLSDEEFQDMIKKDITDIVKGW